MGSGGMKYVWTLGLPRARTVPLAAWEAVDGTDGLLQISVGIKVFLIVSVPVEVSVPRVGDYGPRALLLYFWSVNSCGHATRMSI